MQEFLLSPEGLSTNPLYSSLRDPFPTDWSCTSTYDDIKAQPAKAVADVLCMPLLHICNQAFTTAIFPNAMKIARVAVLHKGGPMDNINNYIPISVLPIFSKLLEYLIKKRLTKFLDSTGAIVDQQFGFRKHPSSEMALLNIKEMILNNFENKEYTIGLFLDFRKVFDSIKHDILFDKLPFYGMRGVALNFLRSYLSKRLQFTSLNGYRSSTKGISCGVPQGSILGPLLFILYINDIVHIPSTPVITHYADDTSVFFWSVSA